MTLPGWPVTRPERVLIGAHRGASAQAPENSAAAFRAALKTGADFVETDLRLSADGVAVACHDADLARLCGDGRKVAGLTLAELRAADPQLLTIAEVLRIALPAALVLIDVKLTDLAALARLPAAMKWADAGGRVALGLRSLAAAQALAGHFAGWPRLALFGDPRDHAAFAAIGGRWARLWQHDASDAAIADLHRLGLNAVVMAGMPTAAGVGEIAAPELTGLIGCGADAVMLNDPALAVSLRGAVRRRQAAP